GKIEALENELRSVQSLSGDQVKALKDHDGFMTRLVEDLQDHDGFMTRLVEDLQAEGCVGAEGGEGVLDEYRGMVRKLEEKNLGLLRDLALLKIQDTIMTSTVAKLKDDLVELARLKRDLTKAAHLQETAERALAELKQQSDSASTEAYEVIKESAAQDTLRTRLQDNLETAQDEIHDAKIRIGELEMEVFTMREEKKVRDEELGVLHAEKRAREQAAEDTSKAAEDTSKVTALAAEDTSKVTAHDSFMTKLAQQLQGQVREEASRVEKLSHEIELAGMEDVVAHAKEASHALLAKATAQVKVEHDAGTKMLARVAFLNQLSRPSITPSGGRAWQAA
ncbi:hypothetical protein T484DRAFT_1782804, partial [Baffinella frigidus]